MDDSGLRVRRHKLGRALTRAILARAFRASVPRHGLRASCSKAARGGSCASSSSMLGGKASPETGEVGRRSCTATPQAVPWSTRLKPFDCLLVAVRWDQRMLGRLNHSQFLPRPISTANAAGRSSMSLSAVSGSKKPRSPLTVLWRLRLFDGRGGCCQAHRDRVRLTSSTVPGRVRVVPFCSHRAVRSIAPDVLKN